MSTSRAEQRKSANVKQESFEQEWAKRAEAASKAETKQKPSVPKLELRSVTDPGSVAKTQEKSAWQAHTSVPSLGLSTTTTQTVTTTQTDTIDHTQSISHSAPVVTPRKQLRFASGSDAISDSPREKNSPRSEKTTDSPRRNQVRSKESSRGLKVSGSSAISTPPASPAVTPREKNEVESPRSLKAAQLRKNVSKKFSKVALDLSKIGEKITTERHSPPSSPGSAGRVSPSKTTPRKKESAFIKSLPFTVRNLAAKCFIELQKQEVFVNAGSAKKTIMLNARLIGVLADHGINYKQEEVGLLATDAKNRSKNLVINTEVDLNNPEYASFYEAAADAAFMKPWAKDSSDISDINGNPMGDRTKAKETFIRDFANSTYKFKGQNGSDKDISSIEEFLKFFEAHENKNIGMIVSNIASQNLGMFLKNSLFMRRDKNGNSQSVLRLIDDTPINPLANFKAVYVLSMDSRGNIVIDYQSHCDSKTGKGGLRATTLAENAQRIDIGDDANITINTRVVIEPSGEWSIENPHVQAEFWNVKKGD